MSKGRKTAKESPKPDSSEEGSVTRICCYKAKKTAVDQRRNVNLKLSGSGNRERDAPTLSQGTIHGTRIKAFVSLRTDCATARTYREDGSTLASEGQ